MHASTAHHRWRRLVALSYAVLLGGILPFICWGAWAEPGHPHGRPHFVFLMPELGVNHGGVSPEAHFATVPPQPGHAQHRHADDGQAPASQATPDLLLGLLAFGLLISLFVYTYRACYEARQACRFAPVLSHAPGVPTPPPRLLSAFI